MQLYNEKDKSSSVLLDSADILGAKTIVGLFHAMSQ
jgi:hypothetical protein